MLPSKYICFYCVSDGKVLAANVLRKLEVRNQNMFNCHSFGILVSLSLNNSVPECSCLDLWVFVFRIFQLKMYHTYQSHCAFSFGKTDFPKPFYLLESSRSAKLCKLLHCSNSKGYIWDPYMNIPYMHTENSKNEGLWIKSMPDERYHYLLCGYFLSIQVLMIK